MTPNETLAVLLTLANRVPAEHIIPDRAMAVLWHGDIGKYESAAALNVAEHWMGKDFPSAGEFLASVQAEARRLAVERTDAQHQEYMLGDPGGSKCPHDCDGGWLLAPPNEVGYPETVTPCPYCRAPALDAEGKPVDHDPRCTCMTCRYGAGQAAKIRAGEAWQERRKPSVAEIERMREMVNDARVKLGKPPKVYAPLVEPSGSTVDTHRARGNEF